MERPRRFGARHPHQHGNRALRGAQRAIRLQDPHGQQLCGRRNPGHEYAAGRRRVAHRQARHRWRHDVRHNRPAHHECWRHGRADPAGHQARASHQRRYHHCRRLSPGLQFDGFSRQHRHGCAPGIRLQPGQGRKPGRGIRLVPDLHLPARNRWPHHPPASGRPFHAGSRRSSHAFLARGSRPRRTARGSRLAGYAVPTRAARGRTIHQCLAGKRRLRGQPAGSHPDVHASAQGPQRRVRAVRRGR
ncbi:hypothetical protein D3C72_1374170 [compost metagenome]